MGKLEDLEMQLSSLRWKQSSCKHEWGEPVYTPYNKERTTPVFRYLGSDSYHEYVGTGYYDKINCWTRVCKLCGKEERTEKEYDEVVLSRRAPDFR